MVFYFSNRFLSSIRKDVDFLFLSSSPSLNLNVLTYQFVLSNTKSNGLITLSKYPIKLLESVLALTNFDRLILP